MKAGIKKLLSLLCALSLLLASAALVGCGGNTPNDDTQSPGTETTREIPRESEQTPPEGSQATGAETTPDGSQKVEEGTPQKPPQGSPSAGLEYTLNPDGESYSVTGVGTCKDKDIVIPSVYNGLPVKEIGRQAFYKRDSLTSVIIPDSVAYIGGNAFYGCTGLVSMTLPFVGANKAGIGNTTYFGYIFGATGSGYNSSYVPKSLKTVVITGGSIANYAFSNCADLISVTIGNGITSIGDQAFQSCTGLESITIPDSVTSIGNSAFSGCTSLASIAIGNGVTSISNSVISGCTSLVSITVASGNATYRSEGNCLIQNDTLILGCKNSVIPNSVTSIGASAFSGCTGLTNFTVPNGVTSIGSYAFRGCKSLKSITISDSVTSIGSNAFEGCTGLESMTIPFVGESKDGTSNTHFGYIFGASSHRYNSSSVPQSLKTVVITGGSIGSYAFYDCKDLESITLPNSLTDIGEWTFSYCTGLVNVTIPDGLTSIDSFAFNKCTGLVSITVPDSVASIGSCAFSGCTGLVSMTLPFVGGSRDGLFQSFGYIFGAGFSINNSSSVPESLKTVVITGGKIGQEAFYGCKNLESITLPDGITSIGSYAFYNCAGLKSITIPDDVTYIGSDAFYGCKSLTSITIPDSVTYIESYAFSNCTGLVSVTIPNSVTSIGNLAFSNCTGLTSIYYTGTVAQWKAMDRGTLFGWYTDYNCTVYCTDGTLTRYES